MLLKVESESCTEIADFRFLIIYEKPADSGFGLPSLNLTIFDFTESIFLL